MAERYRSEAKISEIALESCKYITDEFSFRELAFRIIKEMKFEDLESLFSFLKKDPKDILNSNIKLSDQEYEEVRHLMDMRCVSYEAEIFVFQKPKVVVLSNTLRAYQEFLSHLNPIERKTKNFKLIRREEELIGIRIDEVMETMDFDNNYNKSGIYKFLEGRVNNNNK